MDILQTFLDLTDYTYCLGEEHELLDRLPEGLQEDEIGNYFMEIGEGSEIMFCAHLDTAAFSKEKVTHVEFRTKTGNQLIIGTDGSTLLGADDKSGVVIMMNMIEHNIPGLYYFFIGEESGLVGSRGILEQNEELFKKYKKCISFDRKAYGSVITRQMGGDCCSDSFANALISEFKKAGMTYQIDRGGVFTDSAVFIDVIPECTNLSVGYFNEHSEHEYQNIDYLERLADVATKVDWESLPTDRKMLVNDTPDPVRLPKKEGDLSDDDLFDLFYELDDLLESTIGIYCLNFDKFIPEKEMLYVEFDKNGKRIPLYVHEDGSLSIGKESYESIEDLKDAIKLYYGDDDDEDDDLGTEIIIGDDDNDDNLDNSNLDELSDSFIENVDIEDFLIQVSDMVDNKDTNIIKAVEIDNILRQYNVKIDALIMWLYKHGNDPNETGGLLWNNELSHFEYEL
jgi:peptidase M28-like protein